MILQGALCMTTNESSSVLVLISELKRFHNLYKKKQLQILFLKKHLKGFNETDLARDHDSSYGSSYDSSSDEEPPSPFEWLFGGLFCVAWLGVFGFSHYKKTQQSGDRQIQASLF